YRTVRAEFKRCIKSDYLRYTFYLEEEVVNNPVRFWSAVKRLKSTDIRVTTMTLDGEEVEGNAAIAEAFARYFKSVYEDSYLDCDQLTAAALGSPDSLRRRRVVGMLVFLKKLVSGVVDCSELLALINFAVLRPSARQRPLFSTHYAISAQ
ncbi:hypothetical protein J6590_104011, partial [Homalodisca vitripennis]